MSMELPEELLSQMWNDVDWEKAEEKLEEYQAELTLAAYRKEYDEIKAIQKELVEDNDIKCLAVRHVVQTTSVPGVDGVKWKTPAEKMRAALSLTAEDYHASPLRQIIIQDKKGKERHPSIPTYHDRAMNVLYAYSLAPIAEATADRKSFAFRRGRSTQDAHAYVLEALKGKSAPKIVIYADIKACYSHIQHAWILQNVPMDKHVLSELLKAGIIFAGELYPAEEQGISEGANLSPYIANIVLDGLQKYIFHGLNGDQEPDDYSDGNMIRFMDDIIVTVRTEENANRVLELIKEFLAVRGLSLSEEKTRICYIDEGFTFMSRTYISKKGVVYSYPSKVAVERFIDELRQYILTFQKSQRDLILGLNSRLKGWASYHRYCDAADAFRRVDVAVQAALWEAARKKHPKKSIQEIKAKYWYKEFNGKYCYALPDDKSVRVIRLANTVLLMRNKVRTNVNPFLDAEYTESRTHEREIQNVTGPYRAVWERQNGRCHYCGRAILADQPRTIVTRNLSRPPSMKNSAYIHRICALNDVEFFRTDKDATYLRPYDVLEILGEIRAEAKSSSRDKAEITEDWKYYALKQYFRKCESASVTLTFKEIEKILKAPLPEYARTGEAFWYPCKQSNRIAEAWLTEGYVLKKLDLAKKKVTLRRETACLSHLQIPDVILNGRLPENAVYELETHMKYIIQKYGL